MTSDSPHPNPAVNGVSHITTTSLHTTIRKVTKLYTQQRFPEAYTLAKQQLDAGLPRNERVDWVAWEALCMLFLKIAGRVKDEQGRDLGGEWEYVIGRCARMGRDVSGQVVCAGVQLLNNPALSRTLIETWLATMSDATYNAIATSSHQNQSTSTEERLPHPRTGYQKVVEWYCLRILPQMGDWVGARAFLEMNEVLDEAERLEYLEQLDMAQMEQEVVAKSAQQKSSKPNGVKPTDRSPPSVSSSPSAAVTKAATASQLSSTPEPNIAHPHNHSTNSPPRTSPASASTKPAPSPQSQSTKVIVPSPKPPPPTHTNHNALLRRLSPLAALLALLVLASLLRRLKRTRAGRVVSMVVERVVGTLKMGFNLQTI
ncbi:uncharacterized protein EV422DRAFT_572418 [Fimicolochytrium jonesii]|uniref:uncharacterized protein n=1 Tax=Fimicolochytrium jonesii TaxID=1396493 RepID=UPI0022FE0455|nr:uncharacterized protein EV422DRAFT_572418 [Fimicolochytrium jonesii]KAI8815832.1 hypothetical protein EV422DRAFT_572418 [Fimicolochytrium jonesii]